MSKLSVCVMFLSVFILNSSLMAYYGDGTATSPYLIEHIEDLLLLTSDTDNYDKYFLQTQDIDISDFPTEDAFIAYGDIEFTGSYDGGGHIISGLTIENSADDDSADYLGFFGKAGVGSQLRRIHLTYASVIGRNYIGGLAGWSAGDISDCSVDAAVSGASGVGSIAGTLSNSTISRCKGDGSLSCDYNAGGIAGRGDGVSFINCYSESNMDAVSNNHGGIIGYANGLTLRNCYFSGSVNGSYTSGGWLSGFAQGAAIYDSFYNNGLTNLTDQSTFTNWDFSNETVNGTEGIWLMTDGEKPKLNFEGFLVISDSSPVVFEVFTLDTEKNFQFSIDLSKTPTFEVCVFTVSAGGCSWITDIDPVSEEIVGDDILTLVVSVDLGALDVGNYDCQIIIHSVEDNIDYNIPVIARVIQPVGMEKFAELAQYWLAGDCYGGSDCLGADYSISGTIDIHDLEILAASWLEADVKSEFFDDFESGQLNSHFWSNYFYPIFSVITASDGNLLLESNSNLNTLLLNVDTAGKTTLSFDLSVYSEGDMALQLKVNDATWLWTETAAMHTEILEVPLTGEDDNIMFLFQKTYTSSSYVRIDNVRLN